MRNPDIITPAIVLSGHTMALGVVRALGAMGVPVVNLHYDERDVAHTSRHITHSIRVPHPERSEQEFIGALGECARQYEGGVLFPVSDESVVAVARHRENLGRHFRVACPEWDVVRKFIDKKHTYTLAEESGVPAPRTITPSSLEEAEAYGRQIEYPCLVKPSQSHRFYERFGKKMFSVSALDELLRVYGQASAAGLEVMLQEIIPGEDSQVVNYNAYFHRGEALAEFTAVHVRNAPPSWGSPRVAASADIPEVIEPGRRILRALDFEGYACTEFKRDSRDGVYKLMEVNGRHNLSTMLAVRCGINFPWLHYRHLAYGDTPSTQGFETGIHWIDITRDVGYSIIHRRQERYSLKQYLEPYLRRHVFAIFDWGDPAPFFARCAFLGKQASQKAAAHLDGTRRERSHAGDGAASADSQIALT